MSFLSVLGKIAGGLTGLGSVMGAQQQGKTQGKIAQAQLNQSQDRNALDRYQAMQNAEMQAGNLDLNRQGFETSNRAANAKQALIGALLSGGALPTSLKGGEASGGLFRSLLSNPDAIAAMRNLGGQGDKAQMAPPSYTGGKVLNAPSLTPLQQVDKGGFMSGLANALQLGGLAAGSLPQGGPSIPIPNVPTGEMAGLPGTSIALNLADLMKKPTITVDDEGDGSNR